MDNIGKKININEFTPPQSPGNQPKNKKSKRKSKSKLVDGPTPLTKFAK